MEFRVLGPVDVVHDGHCVPFTRRQQRVILGILALHAGEILSLDRLIDLVWADRPPHHARAVVQSRISEIRATLATFGDNTVALRSPGGGYLLETPAEQVDAGRFRTAVGSWRGHPDEQARAQLRGALALWRGPVLGGWLPVGSQAELSAALEAARLAATEDLFDVELRLGHHADVVDEIVRLAAAHPSRERLAGQMMLALARSGRGAEALQAYDRLRRWLRDGLGADPGPELRALHAGLLRGDTAPAAEAGPAPFAAAVPRTLPPHIADFTGRAAEVRQLLDLLRAPDGPGITIAAVTGPGGAGKTALAVQVAHLLADDLPDGQLYADLRGVDRDDAADPFDVLGGFLRALGVDGLGLPATLDGRAEVYRQLLAGRRTVVVLDNAACDEQVRSLLPGSPGCRVIVTSRARLGATVGARSLPVDVMAADDAVDLLARMAGWSRVEAEPAAAADLVRRCGGLPLALRVAGARLATKPHWSIGKLVRLLDDEHDRLDRLAHGGLDVRASIALSYVGLSPAAQGLLRHLGHLDLPEASVWLSAAVLDARPAVAEELLEQLFDAQLLDYAGRGADDYPRYHLHDLVRLFAREQAAGEPAAELEAAQTRAFGSFLFMAESLLHALYGGDYLTVHADAPRRPVDPRGIGTSATDLLRWFDAEQPSLVAVIRRGARDGRTAATWDLACTTSLLFPMRRRYDDWQTVLDAALEVTTGDPGDQRGQAAILYRLGMLATDRQDLDLAWARFSTAERLFERAGDAHGIAIAGTFLAMIERFRRDPEAALRRYEAVLPGLTAAGDHGGVAFVLRGIGQTHMMLGDDEAADAYFERALTVHRGLSCSAVGGAQVLFWRGMLRLGQHRYDVAEPMFVEVLSATGVLGDQHGQAQALRGLAVCLHHRGRTDDARYLLGQALQLVVQPRPLMVEAQVRETMRELLGIES
jgi:DNA-binding SARP family transcriptional activator/tetratricopeptide (TPR) repeat protein